MTRQIFYLMSGSAHLPYLVCSLYKLRKWCEDIPITVYAWKESYDIALRIACDDRLPKFGVRLRVVDYPKRRNKYQFLDKIKLVQTLDCDVALYLDADTFVQGDLDTIFRRAESHGFAATQFSNWYSQGGVIQTRVGRLKEFPKINQGYVHSILTRLWPSPNGGVWAANPKSPVLPVWEEWTEEVMSIFIPDETVLHILQPMFWPTGQMITLCDDGKWNCSPKYQPETLRDKDVVVRHFHGDSGVRPTKSPRGFYLWWTAYQEAMSMNLGGIREWRDKIKNKYMDILENK